jgi:hypothetical protein
MTCQIKQGVDFFIQQKELQFVNLLNLQYQREASAVYFYHHYRNLVVASLRNSVADPDPGSGAFFDPLFRNRSFFRISDPGSQIHIFESLLTIFLVKSSIIL